VSTTGGGPVIRVENLCLGLATGEAVVQDVSFSVNSGEILGLVGESGSGKTTISRCVGGLHRQWTGELTFEGRPLGKGSRARSAEDRKRIQYIFQNPYLSLNPRLTIQQIVSRPMELFGIAKGKEARDRVVELLDAVALGPTVLNLQTTRLSGGERQRVAIARALAAEPDVLICDEITSALDVSVQAAIIELLHALQRDLGLAMLFVTHNLPLVRTIAQRLAVMTEGRIVETGSSETIIATPQADYTRRLLSDSPVVLKGA